MKIAVCTSNNIANIRNLIMGKNILSKLIKEDYNWAEKFALSLDQFNVDYELINIDKNDWIERIENYDVLIWKPAFMGIKSSQHFRSKVYFIQHVMKKRIYPNYETVWHFDNKNAQSYFFKYKQIASPKTFTSFDYNDVMERAKNFRYPFIVKEPNGAGSTGVKLVKNEKQFAKIVNKKFIFNKIASRFFKTSLLDRFGDIYVQEFLENNDADLRINIIGNKFATGFWRNNRPNDFRASGSGSIDYERELPQEVIKYCWQISNENKFDSMAYDILFKGNQFLIIEMSYGYSDSAVYKTSGYYELNSEGNILGFVKGNYWPQELWVKWLIHNEI